MIRKRTLLAIASLLLISGCKVGPNYQRPAVTVPPQYRGGAPDLTNQPAAASIAEMQWGAVFQDEVLKGLIQEALTEQLRHPHCGYAHSAGPERMWELSAPINCQL